MKECSNTEGWNSRATLTQGQKYLTPKGRAGNSYRFSFTNNQHEERSINVNKENIYSKRFNKSAINVNISPQSISNTNILRETSSFLLNIEPSVLNNI